MILVENDTFQVVLAAATGTGHLVQAATERGIVKTVSVSTVKRILKKRLIAPSQPKTIAKAFGHFKFTEK